MPKTNLMKILWGIVLLVVLLPPLAGVWVRHEIERRLEIRIGGDFKPLLLRPAFELKKTQFELSDKIKFVSGSLKVRYNLVPFLNGKNLLRIVLTSEDVEGQLLGPWAKAQGVEIIHCNHFFADLGLGRKGIEEVYAVDVQSPVFQFHIKRSERV